jgi:hypothetical protein
MSSLQEGSIRAAGLEFHYLTTGQGPLALCVHGFPDSPWDLSASSSGAGKGRLSRRGSVQPRLRADRIARGSPSHPYQHDGV